MDILVANLVKAYQDSVKGLDWMSEETKAEALDKLSKFEPKLAIQDLSTIRRRDDRKE